MKQFPSIPHVSDAPDDLFHKGHLWILEKVDGANMRFQLRESGLLRFGDRNRVYEDPNAVPEPYRHAIRDIREGLDRDAFRRAVDNVDSYIFFGEAMHHHVIDYDWERTPSFLGFDVWSADDNRFLSPDVIEGIFDRLGLQSVNAIERERRAQELNPDSYEIPQSVWYDGPAEGVVIRNKRGGRAKLLHPDFQEGDETIPVEGDATALARRYATQQRFRKIAATLEHREQAVTVETLYERTLEDIVREEHKRLYHGTDTIDMGALRSEVAALTRVFLDQK
ncbi:RNA ligase family protein [Haloarcula salina]|uniref:RNA ligase family protein n=1 Tax=Haloarcula salina TaxID=1429914 RepID=UPI003C6F125F